MEGIEQYLRIDTTSPTGLRWICTVSPRIKAGDVAFTCINRGYYRGKFKGQQLLAHRVVWYLANRSTPEFIDHVSGNKLDNSIQNLRAVSRTGNAGNRVDRGTYRVPGSKRWGARIFSGGKSHRLGTFASECEAHTAYLQAKLHHHPTSTERVTQRLV